LCAGTGYYAVVTDNNGNIHQSASFSIVDAVPLTATINVLSNYNGEMISCPNSCNGSAEVTANGGTPTYTYSWLDSNGASVGVSQTVNGLCAGTYNVSINDNNNCSETFVLEIVPPTPLDAVIDVTNSSCQDACNGSLTAQISGGITPYTYQWNDQFLSVAQTLNDLCVGNYEVTATDANGCQISQNASITEPTGLVLVGDSQGSNCNQNDGSATVYVNTGVGPFTYQWNANAGNQTTATATNLFAGCYKRSSNRW
jgi:hypothetical protein